MIKILILAFLLAHPATCKPFAQDSLVVFSRTTTAFAPTYEVQLWEYSTDGTLLQTIALPAEYLAAGIVSQMSLDQNGQILAIPVIEGTAGQSTANLPRVVLTMNSDGNIVDKTSVTGAGFGGDAAFRGVGVNGQDLWMCLGRELSYITRGATSRIVDNVISISGYSFSFIYQTQILGDSLYFIGDDTGFDSMWKFNPIPLSASTAVSVNTQTGLFGPLSFFLYSSSVLYSARGRLERCTVGASVTVEYYTANENIASMVAKQVGSKLFVFLLSSANGEIVRYTDSGSDFTDRTVIVSGIASYQAISIALSPQPTCSDSLKNQDETDVDCGGSKCSTCADGKSCSVNGDCVNSYCNPDKNCSIPSCSDGWKNQDETDVDCGGATCTNKCADGKVCNGNSDCSSKVCNGSSLCAVPACDDTVMNGIETDVDCGGDCTTKCAESKSCVIDGDCLSKNCLNNVCEMSCFDGFKNQNETDIDCGGVCGATCDNGKSCLQDTDCMNAYCNPESVCSNPTCSDGWMNQDETDVDCGGSCVTLCLNGKNCKVDADCQSGSCNSVCVDPPVAPPQSTPIDTPQANNEPSSSTPSDSTTPTGSTTPATSRTPRGKLVSSAIVNVRDCLMALALLLFVLV